MIDSTFGKTKFKCVFRDHQLGLAGLQEACKGAKLRLRYQRFVFDTAKKMIQSAPAPSQLSPDVD